MYGASCYATAKYGGTSGGLFARFTRAFVVLRSIYPQSLTLTRFTRAFVVLRSRAKINIIKILK